MEKNRNTIRRMKHLSEFLCICAACALLHAPDAVGKDRTQRPVRIGLSWTGSSVNTKLKAAIEATGAECVELGQVRLSSLEYDGVKLSECCVEPSGILKGVCADAVKKCCRRGMKGSNVKEIMKDVDAVLFSGGADISPTLYDMPMPVMNNGESFNATRDVSDYILMKYCIARNIPVVGICRGMQMVGVSSGAGMIQHIPFQGVHRRLDSSMPLTRHDIILVPGTKAQAMFGRDTLFAITSTHHQAVVPVRVNHAHIEASAKGRTPALVQSGYFTSNGVEICEIIERTDKTYFFGMQAHPEWAYSDRGTDEDRFVCNVLIGGLCKAAAARKK